MKKAASTSTKGYQKLRNYLEEILTSPLFLNDIVKLRIKYRIPKKGFSEAEYKKWPTTFNFPYKPPKRWAYTNNESHLDKLNKELEELRRKHGLSVEWELFLFEHLYFNKSENTSFMMSGNDLCKIMDFTFENEFMENVTNTTLLQNHKKLLKETYKDYPVAILISPYAKKNDITDFINKSIYGIKKTLEQYRNPNIKIGHYRNRTTREKIQYIWMNKNVKPRKKLANMVNKKFGGHIDELYVRNIISKENKKQM